jgi:DNA-binding NtrC family response regulator
MTRLPTIAASDATVLITGETGTGKELVARAIHYLSRRAAFPFVPVNCGALPDSLIEAELFGHERGAFTGAEARRVGLLRDAEGGTLCLDEIDGLTARGQVGLLRVLQERRFRMVGSNREQPVNSRFIAVTNASLPDLVHRHQFRADLYYRLCVFSIHLRPLRERPEDIVPLAKHFLRKHPPTSGPIPALGPSARDALLAYSWPGNARELENIILRAAQLSLTRSIEADDLGLPRGVGVAERVVRSFNDMKRLVVERFEHDYLARLMREHGGNVSSAARAAGKDRRDLHKLLKKYGIDRSLFSRDAS